MGSTAQYKMLKYFRYIYNIFPLIIYELFDALGLIIT